MHKSNPMRPMCCFPRLSTRTTITQRSEHASETAGCITNAISTGCLYLSTPARRGDESVPRLFQFPAHFPLLHLAHRPRFWTCHCAKSSTHNTRENKRASGSITPQVVDPFSRMKSRISRRCARAGTVLLGHSNACRIKPYRPRLGDA